MHWKLFERSRCSTSTHVVKEPNSDQVQMHSCPEWPSYEHVPLLSFPPSCHRRLFPFSGKQYGYIPPSSSSTSSPWFHFAKTRWHPRRHERIDSISDALLLAIECVHHFPLSMARPRLVVAAQLLCRWASSQTGHVRVCVRAGLLRGTMTDCREILSMALGDSYSEIFMTSFCTLSVHFPEDRASKNIDQSKCSEDHNPDWRA